MRPDGFEPPWTIRRRRYVVWALKTWDYIRFYLSYPSALVFIRFPFSTLGVKGEMNIHVVNGQGQEIN